MAVYSKERGIYKTNNLDLNQNSAIDGMRFYLANHGGVNTTLFSSFKIELAREVLEPQKEHQTKQGYGGWATVLAYLSSGGRGIL